MVRKNLVEGSKKGAVRAKPIEIFERPNPLATASTELAFRILRTLAEQPMYPNDLAKHLRVHEQKVYYHVNRMQKAGLIEVVREENRHGATAKIYAPVAQAFGFELPGEGEEVKLNGVRTDPVLREFFREFVRKGTFDGSIVVGAPTPHGPYDTEARDGHFPAHLAMFLGSLCTVPENRFIVKLDTEVKAENARDRNMILVGGPIVNTIVSDLMEQLEVQLVYDNQWLIRSRRTGKTYADFRDAMIVKTHNPWDPKKAVVILAGIKNEATKTCIIALTHKYGKILRGYSSNRDFYRVVRGLDRDGDGKVDDVEVLE